MSSAEWQNLQAATDDYFAKGLANSTAKTYASGVRRYLNFCSKLGRAPLPATEELVSTFVAMLAKTSITYASIKTYLSAVRHFQIARGMGDPEIPKMARLEYVLKGVRKEGAHSVAKPRKDRQPITPAVLIKLFSVWKHDPEVRDAKMLWAASCLAFFGFLRVGEFTTPGVRSYDEKVHLSTADITVDHSQSPNMVFVCLKQSKTDQLRQGITIVLGRTDQNPLCPVSAMLGYLVVRGRSAGPLFVWKGGHFLTRAQFVAAVKKALGAAGADASEFNGHSFRIGAASTAAARGMEDSMIKTLGRWESDAYQRYIKIPRQDLANYTKILAS